jgi:prefoldin alpha subunit
LLVDLASLSTQQLSQVKKQLDDELEHLTNSFSQLRAAQSKFRECLKSIAGGVNSVVDSELLLVVLSVIDSVGIEKPILVPLTSSLYVPGTLADTDNVIVDVGTGFYVEKVGGGLQAQTLGI